jgi:ribosome-binding factor A
LRRIPELTFDYDDTLEKEMRIEQLLDQIKTEQE